MNEREFMRFIQGKVQSLEDLKKYADEGMQKILEAKIDTLNEIYDYIREANTRRILDL